MLPRARVVLALLAVVTAGCGGTHHALRVRVTPVSSTEDQPVQIRIDGLAPRQGVWLELRSTDANGIAFRSRAAFGADRQGVLDLGRARALSGSSYSGVWPMGLLTSMSAPSAPAFSYYRWGRAPRRFVLTVSSQSRRIASTSFVRRWTRVRYSTVTETVARDGFDGTLYAPVGASHERALLAFGGSEGGDDGSWAERFAAHGIPVLYVGYFHAPGLPDRLVNIPLEYFRAALEWLDRRPEVDPARVSVLGVSYGSEAALLLGVHFPKLVHGVVALVPSSVVTCGIVGAGREGGLTGRLCLGSPWTLGGKPLPHTATLNNPRPWDDARAVIPVERIRAPVFLACGGRDQLWSSCPYARAIVARRKAHGEPTELHVYPAAGHYVGSPFIVYEPGSLARDFFVPQDERGREDLWPRLLAFLHGDRSP